MNRGVNHGRIFFDDRDRLEAGQLLNEIHARFGVETLAYCLMTNHFHLVLRLEDDHLSAAMQHFDGEPARRVNSRVGRDGPLFRGRYHSIPVTTDPYLQFVVRYVHRNALDLPGVDAVERFRWSSMRAYLGLRRPAPFMNLEPVLSMWRNGHSCWSFIDRRPANSSRSAAQRISRRWSNTVWRSTRSVGSTRNANAPPCRRSRAPFMCWSRIGSATPQSPIGSRRSTHRPMRSTPLGRVRGGGRRATVGWTPSSIEWSRRSRQTLRLVPDPR